MPCIERHFINLSLISLLLPKVVTNLTEPFVLALLTTAILFTWIATLLPT